MKADFLPYTIKMNAAGLSEVQVEAFRRHYLKVASGSCQYLLEKKIMPVGSLPKLEELPSKVDSWALKVAVLKLNGGLGTGMGLDGPKSMLRVRNGMSFLEILLQQILWYRRRFGNGAVPLLLLNSFNTSRRSMAFVSVRSEILSQAVPVELMQSRVPKVLADTLAPAEYPDDPAEEWCPPGHGDVFLTLFLSGVLPQLISANIRYLFISNIDNLGAVLDSRIPDWMNANKLPFLIEVSRRFACDNKGGHLARTVDGSFILRERAMCAPEEVAEFSDIDKYKFFNTNNIWIDVAALYKVLLSEGGILKLPLIVNYKHLINSNPDTPKVLQLETAMGSAVHIFPESVALEVPRSRFAPVKNFADLLNVRSDAYTLGEDYSVKLNSNLLHPPLVDLPSKVNTSKSFEQMFPYDSPSLKDCLSLSVEGPVRFGRNVSCKGEVKLKAEQPSNISDGAVLSGEVVL